MSGIVSSVLIDSKTLGPDCTPRTYFLKEESRPPFTLICPSSWAKRLQAERLREELISKVKEWADRLSDQNDSDWPEVTNARYLHLESKVRRLEHSAKTRSRSAEQKRELSRCALYGIWSSLYFGIYCVYKCVNASDQAWNKTTRKYFSSRGFSFSGSCSPQSMNYCCVSDAHFPISHPLSLPCPTTRYNSSLLIFMVIQYQAVVLIKH